ncbi:MAG TPA: amino acid permease [Candidatus Babeliaceae bacterium]|nr:amino acid permease [Candidatus Babeliaceae bacterium]
MSASLPSQEKMGLPIAIIVGMNAMIGASIFTIPAQLQMMVGPAGIITYLLVIVAVWFMALALARVSQRYPEAGSFYTYAYQWGGKVAGTVAVTSYLIGLTVALGLLTQFTGVYLQLYFPQFSPELLGIIALSALVALNMAGAVITKAGQIILITCTVLPLLTIIFLCLTRANLKHLIPFNPYGIKNIFAASKIVIFGFFGFECAASLYGIVKDPERNVGRAITYAIIGTSILYMLFVTSIFLALPSTFFAGAKEPLSAVLLKVFPDKSWLVTFIHASIAITIMGTIYSMSWALGSLLQTTVQKISNNRATLSSKQALTIIGVLAAISCLTVKTVELFMSLTAVCVVIALSLSIIALYLPSKKQAKMDVFIATIGLATAAILLFFAIEGIIESVAR